MLRIPYSQTHLLKSKTNNIEYELFVAVPPNYQNNKNCYPVIFTTDPNFIFPILLGATKSLATMIPDTIIVGIGHADLDFKELDEVTRNARAEIHRARDLLPWKFDKFTKYFITSEIIPFIDQTYRTNTSKRTLIGHSFGGLFASWVALNHPTIFQNYLLISPILHYEDGQIFEEISNLSKTIPTKIYLSAGSRENSHPNFFENLQKFQDATNISPNITTTLKIFEDEYHCSTVPPAIAHGLKFIYQE